MLNLRDEYFEIYPNPSEDGLIYFRGIENVDTKVFNATGRLIQQGKVESVLDLSSFDSGFYYIVLSHSNQIQTIKVIRL